MRSINRLVFIIVLVALMFAGWMVNFATTPVTLQEEVVEVDIRAGSSLRGVSEQLAKQGVLSQPKSFTLMVRMLGMAGDVKAGNYLIENGITPYDLFMTITAGKTTQAGI